MPHASGTYTVELGPLRELRADLIIMSHDTCYSGDLEATSQGERLGAGSRVIGSAGYVMMQQVSGALHGRRGSFTLQYIATLTRNDHQEIGTVVPDSGTDELEGLAGRISLGFTGGEYSYDFEYTLDGAP